MSDKKQIFRFSEGHADMRDLLGGKGANLCEMAHLGLPVPPGFVITTEACRQYYADGGRLPEEFWESIRGYISEIEQAAGHLFGDAENPLLVSVRSGAKFSMPGMMDTILNLGLNAETIKGLTRLSGDERFALDSYRRFIQLFGKVVLDAPEEEFEEALSGARQKAGVATDAELSAQTLQDLVRRFRKIVERVSPDGTFPDDPWTQLRMAVEAVFRSWNSRRAIAYREFEKIPHDLGTACTVMAMVFGNLGWDSATGVAFTRSPETGVKELYGDYLPNAQGEDVVAGVRTPKQIDKGMAEEFPEVYKQLSEIANRLEQHYRDMQDIEFTIEKNRLYFLQTRSAKRTIFAAVKAAVDMADEGLITKDEAVLRVPAADFAQLYLPRFDESAKAQANGRLLGKGINASPGAATGKVAFTVDSAIAMAERGERVVLVRPETAADDMPGILKAVGVLTSRGGRTSHAAVVTRGLGKPAVVGCEGILVDPHAGELRANGHVVREGEELSLDGFTGEVFLGRLPTVVPNVDGNRELSKLLSWVDEARRLRVRANADTPLDAEAAIHNGAEGIGLCRTEHMFFAEERLPYVRQMLNNAQASVQLRQRVTDARELAKEDSSEAAQQQLRQAEALLAESPEWQAYQDALEHLLGYQREDFTGILRVMQGKPVVIRLLDAPLHEFLEPYERVLEEVAALRATEPGSPELAQREQDLAAIARLREVNPMLGHRGCRLGITFPEVYEMQVRAIAEAACKLRKDGIDAHPEIMIPLVADVAELRELNPTLKYVVAQVANNEGVELEIRFGTMIEVPRAALTANEIAQEAAFFSFGSNDLTQMTFGFSRDDAEEKFLSYYVQTKLLPISPFNTLDERGVGRLIELSAKEGRAVKPDLELGICGEHGGDPESVRFCHRVGLDYVSASPHRIPIARLAAAQAAVGDSTRRDV